MSPRVRAALIHLGLSAIVALPVALSIHIAWYPDVLILGAAARHLFFLIVGLVVTMGPFLTLVIFRPGKWGLRFDLWCIAILQLSALAFGAYVMFEARPVYLAFVVDRFAVVRADGFPAGALEKGHANGYDSLSLTGPRLVGVKLPDSPEERFQLAVSAMAGTDAEYYPKYYVPYDDVRVRVRGMGRPIALLRKINAARGAQVDAAVASTGRKEDELRYLPMRSDKADFAVLVDNTGDVLEITSLVPWDER